MPYTKATVQTLCSGCRNTERRTSWLRLRIHPLGPVKAMYLPHFDVHTGDRRAPQSAGIKLRCAPPQARKCILLMVPQALCDVQHSQHSTLHINGFCYLRLPMRIE